MSLDPSVRSRIPIFLGIAIAFAAGAFLRLYFVTSHGSWDTEYWKAWASETSNKGAAFAYGGPEAVPPGEFVDQLLGRKERTEVSFRDREFPIDYPPLGLSAWGSSWRFFTSKPRPYRGPEAENLAVKFPALLGDVLAVAVLIVAFRGTPLLGLGLAALYWAFPVTWVSSAALGFFDGFVAPFLLVSLWLAPTAPLAAAFTFGITCLIKPTAVVALPVLFIAIPKAKWPQVVAGGALSAFLVALPYVFAGTLETAIVHVGRIFTQDRVSGGYANPWWLFGHVSNILQDRAEWSDPVAYVRRDAFAAPLGLIGFVLAGLAVAWIVLHGRRARTRPAFVYLAALMLFAWGVLTVGVHDNHNHPLFLLLVATGLATPFVRSFATFAALSTVFGSLCLHGLGRFYGVQWRPVLPLADSVARMRMALGFDLTLALSLVNCLLLVLALRRLPRTIEEIESAAHGGDRSP